MYRNARETVRCAIYCRKSVEDGLEQEFNSLDAQRESGENYIASQKANGQYHRDKSDFYSCAAVPEFWRK